MKIQPECRPCLEHLVDLTVALATDDPRRQRQAAAAAREIIARKFGRPGAIPALIASDFHRAIQETSHNPDPFAARKAAGTAHLAGMARHLIPAGSAGLEALLQLAARGNAVDFFRGEAEVTRELLSPLEFGAWDLDRLLQALEGPAGLILFLADNAGEQFFDLPLVEFLRRLGWRVVYVVKGGPVQNDLTRADLEASGLGPALEPVADTGANTVGLNLGDVSPEFQALYKAAGLILAKGMGHFETMSHLGDPRVFFLLQAKCVPVAQALGVRRGAFALVRGAAISLDKQAKMG